MLSIITVNYNSRHYLQKLIASIEKYFDFEKIELVIANNDASRLHHEDLIKNPGLKIRIIENGGNAGFGSACNIGAQNAEGKWLLFANPDIEFVDNSAFNALNFLEKKRGELVIGAKIIEASKNAVQPWTCGKKMTLTSILFRNTLLKPWHKKNALEVDWVSGTALLISKNNFKEIGGFDETFFMYFEDQDLCLRAKKAGSKILFYPDFNVLHHNGKSWGKHRKGQKGHYYRSQELFFQKHNSRLELLALKFLRKILKGY